MDIRFTIAKPQVIIEAKDEPKQLREVRISPDCTTVTLGYNEPTNNPMEMGGPIEYIHIEHDEKVASAWLALLLADLATVQGVKDLPKVEALSAEE